MYFFDNDTGEKIGEFNNVESLNLTLETEKENNDEKVMNFSKSRTFTGTFDAKVLLIPVYVQVRKHRKKRINKKWLKQYGIKMILVDVKTLNDENSYRWYL